MEISGLKRYLASTVARWAVDAWRDSPSVASSRLASLSGKAVALETFVRLVMDNPHGCDLAQRNLEPVMRWSAAASCGTFVLTNLAGALAGGQRYQLFSAANSSGNFSSLSPASPGPNLAWSFNPVDGYLSVVSLAPPQIMRMVPGPDGSFTLSGIGPVGEPYRILATTNAGLPLANWPGVAAGVFTGGAFTFNDTQASNHAQRFYRVATP